jgi:Animal haem peroxidase
MQKPIVSHGGVASAGNVGQPPVGRFGRLFRTGAGEAPFDQAIFGATPEIQAQNMKLLGKAMTAKFDKPKDGPDDEESGIPALYTYFGQFVDHDLTFGPEGRFRTAPFPDVTAIEDERTAAFDLDCVYGRGPDEQPYLFEADPGANPLTAAPRRMLVGDPVHGVGAPDSFDLPRNNAQPRRALIGDKRNDENAIVSQLHALFLRFHNRLAQENPDRSFDEVRQQVVWHYQWIVLNDFLPRIVHSSVIAALKTHGRWDPAQLKLFPLSVPPFMPVEFSVGAYRLGHSMIRPGYRLNDNDHTLLPIFPVPDADLHEGLTGFRALNPDWAIDWGRFIDIEARAYGAPDVDGQALSPALAAANRRRMQLAYRIDTSLVDPISHLPMFAAGDIASLAERNLRRGIEFGLPSGQQVALILKEMGLHPGEPINPASIMLGKATGNPDDVLALQAALNAAAQALNATRPQVSTDDVQRAIATFTFHTPLWLYILAEAALHPEQETVYRIDQGGPPEGKISTPKLGPVGGRIVAETFLALMADDADSYLNAKGGFTPVSGADFRLRDFVSYALGSP